MQMTFLGCIGYLMQGNGLKETLEVTYAPAYAPNAVIHMMSGIAVSCAVRGHFIVHSALNALITSEAFGIEDIDSGQHNHCIPETVNVANGYEPLTENDANDNPNLPVTEGIIDEAITSSTEASQCCSQENPLTNSDDSSHLDNYSSTEDLEEVLGLYDKLMTKEITVESLYDEEIIDKIAETFKDAKESMKRSRTSTFWL